MFKNEQAIYFLFGVMNPSKDIEVNEFTRTPELHCKWY